MKQRIIQGIILIFFILATFQPPVDLDLGWHLRYGQYFFQTGHVLKDNTLSYVWPDYKWIQASWGYDLLVYQIFTHFGFVGLTISATLITLLIFWLLTKPIDRFSPFQLFFLATIFLTQTDPLYSTGLRSQTPSALFFAIVLIIAQSTFTPADKKSFLSTKAKYFLPLLFFLWANTHGGFTLGLAVIGLIWFGHGLLMLVGRLKHQPQNNVTSSSKEWLVFGLILAASFLTPLINSWGTRIYEETLKHSTTINLTGIAEWAPLTHNQPAAIVAALLTCLVFLLVLWRKKAGDLPYLLAFVLITALAFGAIRFLILFGIMATYFLAQNIQDFKQIFSKLPNRQNFVWGLKLIIVLLVFYDAFGPHIYFVPPDFRVLTFSWQNYCEFMRDCSEDLTQNMLRHPPQGNGYNPYNYGGYLSWRVPTVKTFLDGRMAAWARGDETPPIIQNDQAILNGGVLPFRQLDNTYHFHWVIIQTPTQVGQYLESLARAGLWKKQYQDSYYSLYIRNIQ